MGSEEDTEKFGTLLLCLKIGVMLGCLGFQVVAVKNHRTILNQKGKYCSVIVELDDELWESRSRMCQQLQKGWDCQRVHPLLQSTGFL